MAAVVLDADVVIGLLNADDAHHKRAISRLRELADRPLLMAMSTYSEILVGMINEHREEVVEGLLERAPIELVPSSRSIARSAAALRAAHGALRLPDALSLATALERGAELITFDKRLRRIATEHP